MPSPFPGMDPYLENPAIFPGLHDRMIVGMSEFLQAHLPEPYFAEVADRVWVEEADRHVGPDVDVLRSENDRPGVKSAQGGTAVAYRPRSEPIPIPVFHDEFRETFMNIVARQEGERVVTTIEILSPTNKTRGQEGRDLYQAKQRQVLRSEVHLIEIDLLRAGTHTTAVPLDKAREKAGLFDYHVSVRRFNVPLKLFIYPIRLEDCLPEIAVPLLPADPDVALDLQKVFDRCYDTGPYRRRIRYPEATPVPPLRPDQAEWAAKILKEKGIMAKP